MARPVCAPTCRLSSGRYTLVDVACRCCGTTLGWRYVRCSAGPEMMYKQGCSLLEQVNECCHPGLLFAWLSLVLSSIPTDTVTPSPKAVIAQRHPDRALLTDEATSVWLSAHMHLQRHLRATPSRSSLEAARQHIQSMSRGSGAGPSQAQQGSASHGAAGGQAPPPGASGNGAGTNDNNNSSNTGRSQQTQWRQQSALHRRMEHRQYFAPEAREQYGALRAMSGHVTHDTYVTGHDVAECMDLAALMSLSHRASQEWQAALARYHAAAAPAEGSQL
jgi:hypothetical protein